MTSVNVIEFDSSFEDIQEKLLLFSEVGYCLFSLSKEFEILNLLADYRTSKLFVLTTMKE
jgi:hypothetical protein